MAGRGDPETVDIAGILDCFPPRYARGRNDQNWLNQGLPNQTIVSDPVFLDLELGGDKEER